MFYRLVFVLIGCAFSGCAEQAAMRLAQDTVKIRVSTAPIYGQLEPMRRALRIAAEETVKAGFDKFTIEGEKNLSKQKMLSHTAGQAPSTSSAMVSSGYGTADAQSGYIGPQTIGMPRFQSDIVVKMFKAEDPLGANAINAQQVL